jgi:hypothetical protein
MTAYDGNAIAGQLEELFGGDMTMAAIFRTCTTTNIQSVCNHAKMKG